MSIPIIEIKNIHKSFYNKKIKKNVLNGVSLNINKGETVSLFGYSGEGKTTLLSIICGIIKQDKGNIVFDGKNIDNQEPFERHIPIVMDEPLLFPHMNIKENIIFGLKLLRNRGENIGRSANQLMEILNIKGLENHMPGEISMGQAQRVSIARALSINPKILLMDEPFSNLDIVSKEKVKHLIKSIQIEMDITVLLVTHDISDIISFSDKMYILNNAKIQEQGVPENLLKKYQKWKLKQKAEKK